MEIAQGFATGKAPNTTKMATAKKKKTVKRVPPVKKRSIPKHAEKKPAKPADNGMSISRKKEYAKLLYLKQDFTQKEIAVKVGTSETSLSKWVREGSWDGLRRSLVVTKEEILGRLYDVMNSVSLRIKESNSCDAKDADALNKISSSIRNLETDVNIGDMMEVAKKFIKWLQLIDMDFAAKVMEHFDMYFKERLKRS